MSAERNHEPQSETKPPKHSERQKYQSPAFSLYGKIDRLTGGGSGATKESTAPTSTATTRKLG